MRCTYFCYCCLVLILSAMAAFMPGEGMAQQVEISSTLNPVGSGARATGMGGAFISVADDATAASWNPAGLIHLERPELSVAGTYFSRSQAYHSDQHPEVDSSSSIDATGLNYASAAWPFVFLKRNMTISLNYQRLFEMNKHSSFTLKRLFIKTTLTDVINFNQNGHLYALSPAFAVQALPNLYLGATLNLYMDCFGKNGWESQYASTATGIISKHPFIERTNQTEKVSFKGTNANLGFLWNLSGPFTLGGIYKTAFDARLNKDMVFATTTDYTDLGVHTENSTATSSDFIMKMPASYGLGVSYRHSDKLNIALDIYRTDWSRFFLKDSEGNEINPLNGQLLSKGKLKDTMQVRLGSEYLVIKDKYVIPLRAGIFYDPEPATNSLDDFYGFSLGTGYSTRKFSLDASYQFRFGRRVTGDMSSVEGISANMNQHTVMLSLIYYF